MGRLFRQPESPHMATGNPMFTGLNAVGYALNIFFVKRREETMNVAGMAGRTHRFRLDKQGIILAVLVYFFHLEIIAGGCALVPDFLPAAAVEHRFAFFQRHFDGLGVHVAQHQHRPGVDVLDDGRYKPFVIVIQFVFHCLYFHESR